MADRAEETAAQIMNSLPEHRRTEFQIAYQGQKKNRQTALLLSLFLGWLAVDRFYLGQTLLAVAKLLTLGGCGLWTFVDWFIIMSAADSVNIDVLHKLRQLYAPPQPAQFHAYGPPPGAYAPHGYGPPPGGYGPPPR